MEKKNFSASEIEVISFDQVDIIRTSDGTSVGTEIEQPKNDWD
jgi:hypothetical protein